MAKTKVAIHGAGGRMGQRLVALSSADAELQLAAAIESSNHLRLGDDAGLLAGVGPLGVKLSTGSTRGRCGDRFFRSRRGTAAAGTLRDPQAAAGAGDDRIQPGRGGSHTSGG